MAFFKSKKDAEIDALTENIKVLEDALSLKESELRSALTDSILYQSNYDITYAELVDLKDGIRDKDAEIFVLYEAKVQLEARLASNHSFDTFNLDTEGEPTIKKGSGFKHIERISIDTVVNNFIYFICYVLKESKGVVSSRLDVVDLIDLYGEVIGGVGVDVYLNANNLNSSQWCGKNLDVDMQLYNAYISYHRGRYSTSTIDNVLSELYAVGGNLLKEYKGVVGC